MTARLLRMLRKECATSYGGVEEEMKVAVCFVCLDPSLVPGGQRACIPASNQVALPASVFTPPCPYLHKVRCNRRRRPTWLESPLCGQCHLVQPSSGPRVWSCLAHGVERRLRSASGLSTSVARRGPRSGQPVPVKSPVHRSPCTSPASALSCL